MRYFRVIRMEDTDMTGVIFFARLHAIALEALEYSLAEIGLKVSSLVQQGYYLPIVHSEADFMKPIFLDDCLQIEVFLAEINSKSLSFAFEFTKQNETVAIAKLTHVLVDRESKKGIVIPQQIGERLSSLPKKEVNLLLASSANRLDKEKNGR